MSQESWFHLGEMIVMIVFGSPCVWGILRIVSLLRDFPPHRHFNGKIMYPKGYEPPEVVSASKRD